MCVVWLGQRLSTGAPGPAEITWLISTRRSGHGGPGLPAWDERARLGWHLEPVTDPWPRPGRGGSRRALVGVAPWLVLIGIALAWDVLGLDTGPRSYHLTVSRSRRPTGRSMPPSSSSGCWRGSASARPGPGHPSRYPGSRRRERAPDQTPPVQDPRSARAWRLSASATRPRRASSCPRARPWGSPSGSRSRSRGRHGPRRPPIGGPGGDGRGARPLHRHADTGKGRPDRGLGVRGIPPLRPLRPSG